MSPSINLNGVNVLDHITFAFLPLGAMTPYWIAALSMRSVDKAAGETVQETLGWCCLALLQLIKLYPVCRPALIHYSRKAAPRAGSLVQVWLSFRFVAESGPDAHNYSRRHGR